MGGKKKTGGPPERVSPERLEILVKELEALPGSASLDEFNAVGRDLCGEDKFALFLAFANRVDWDAVRKEAEAPSSLLDETDSCFTVGEVEQLMLAGLTTSEIDMIRQRRQLERRQLEGGRNRREFNNGLKEVTLPEQPTWEEYLVLARSLPAVVDIVEFFEQGVRLVTGRSSIALDPRWPTALDEQSPERAGLVLLSALIEAFSTPLEHDARKQATPLEAWRRIAFIRPWQARGGLEHLRNPVMLHKVIRAAREVADKSPSPNLLVARALDAVTRVGPLVKNDGLFWLENTDEEDFPEAERESTTAHARMLIAALTLVDERFAELLGGPGELEWVVKTIQTSGDPREQLAKLAIRSGAFDLSEVSLAEAIKTLGVKLKRHETDRKAEAARQKALDAERLKTNKRAIRRALESHPQTIAELGRSTKVKPRTAREKALGAMMKEGRVIKTTAGRYEMVPRETRTKS